MVPELRSYMFVVGVPLSWLARGHWRQKPEVRARLALLAVVLHRAGWGYPRIAELMQYASHNCAMVIVRLVPDCQAVRDLIDTCTRYRFEGHACDVEAIAAAAEAAVLNHIKERHKA